MLLRARDRDAAGTLQDEEVAANGDIDHPIDGVTGLADSKCFALRLDSSMSDLGIKFQCYVEHDRYVAATFTSEEADARQCAAAEYALLAAP